MFVPFYTDFNDSFNFHNLKIRQSATTFFNSVDFGIEPLLDCRNCFMVTMNDVILKTPKRFWSKIKFGEPDECWEWQASKNKKGYGTFHIPKSISTSLSHRYLYIQLYGDVNDFVCHRCDNPPCCNPNHFFIGTNADNMKDMAIKGRHVSFKGSSHTNAKLNEQQVFEIKKMIAHTPVSEIASQFKVCESTIYHIKNKRRWQHL